MTRPMGPSLPVREAAAYLGMAESTLRTKWRRWPALVRGATRGGGMPLSFTVPSLEAHKQAHRVSRAQEAAHA